MTDDAMIEIALTDRGELPRGWARVVPPPGDSVVIEAALLYGVVDGTPPWVVSLFGRPVRCWDWIASKPVVPESSPEPPGRQWLETGGVVLVLTELLTPEG